MVPRAGIFPAELTALRGAGLLIGIAIVAYAITRRRSLRNADMLILLAAGLGLALVSGTEITDAAALRLLLPEGQRRPHPRPCGLRDLHPLPDDPAGALAGATSRQLSAALEGLAWRSSVRAHLPERFRDKIAILVPAYNEAENIGHVLDQMPAQVCGRGDRDAGRRRRLRDGTGDVAAGTAPRSPATSPTAAAAPPCARATG